MNLANLTSACLIATLVFSYSGCNQDVKHEAKSPPSPQVSAQQQSQNLYPYAAKRFPAPSGRGGSFASVGGLDSGANWETVNGARVYRVGRDVTAPRPIRAHGPACSVLPSGKSQQNTKVMLWAVIGTDGRVHNPRVLWAPSAESSKRVLESVANWQFVPGHKDKQPVPVQVNLSVDSCT